MDLRPYDIGEQTQDPSAALRMTVKYALRMTEVDSSG